MIIRKPKLIFNVLPINFQVSFVARLFSRDDGTLISGKFNAPRLFYRMYISVFLIFSCIFLLAVNAAYGSVFHVLPSLVILGGAAFLFIRFFIAISCIFFNKQNKMVLDFLELLTTAFSQKDLSVTEKKFLNQLEK